MKPDLLFFMEVVHCLTRAISQGAKKMCSKAAQVVSQACAVWPARLQSECEN